MKPGSLPRWLGSVHSEHNDEYVSPCFPRLGDEVSVRLRLAKDAPVKRIFFRTLINGADVGFKMSKLREGGRFHWFEHRFIISQPSMNYSFMLETDEAYYFVTRRRITDYHQTEDFDWVLLADFQAPDWVESSVFYQIFPDRFAKGDPEIGVQSGEYDFDGFSTQAMKWSDHPLSWDKAHCLDFFNGDLEGIRQKLGYLQALGITALFLNPVFLGSTVHRYDCNDYFQVDPHLGGNEALIRLSQEVHKLGLKLILDVSINHTGIGHRWIKKALEDPSSEEAGFYHRTPDGGFSGWMGVPTLPQLDYSSQALRRIMYEGEDSLIRTFLRPPYSLDGWRFDVGNHTANRGSAQLGQEVFRGVRRAAKEVNPKAYLVAEHWQDNISYQQGDLWDGAMNYFASARPLRRFMGELDRFVFNQLHCINFKPGTGWDLEDQFLQHFARLPGPTVFYQMNVLDTHDIHRVHTNSELFDWELYRGLLYVFFLLPGTPSIYYGDEVGLAGESDSTEGCRFPMEWDPEKWKKPFFELYSTLSRLRRDEKTLHRGAFRVLYADETTFVWCRFDSRKAFIAVLNRSRELKTIRFAVDILGLVSAREIFSGASARLEDGDVILPLQARENLLFQGECED